MEASGAQAAYYLYSLFLSLSSVSLSLPSLTLSLCMQEIESSEQQAAYNYTRNSND
jgi:hypothetical protein